MIKEKSISSFLVFFFLLFSVVAQQRSPVTIYFTTLGNCGICQNRIQNAVKELPGVDTVYWNIEKDQTTVTYDESVTDAYVIMHAIANAGHDNEWFPAPDSAYNLLVGSCCEYLRTIDYGQVQVGYLSMMDKWFYPLAISEARPSEIRVFPTIGPGIFELSVNGDQPAIVHKLSVFSMTGQQILTRKLSPGSSCSVDLRAFPDGEYFLVIYNSSRNISTTKVIKLN